MSEKTKEINNSDDSELITPGKKNYNGKLGSIKLSDGEDEKDVSFLGDNSEGSSGEHHHHHRRKEKSDAKCFAYCVVSFFLALILFLLTCCIALRTTVFSSDYMLSVMADREYYTQITEELRQQLESLSHASGLSSEFANDFTNSLDLREDVTQYVESFYNGSSTVINTTHFKQKFRAALDSYIEDNKKKNTEVKEESLEYLVNEAADLYSNTIEIPFFSVVANYVVKLNVPLTVTIVVLTIIGIVLTLILFLTNEFKHRGYRYLSYAFIAAFICDAAVAGLVYFSKIFSKVNIMTRSLYNLFVYYFNGIFTYFWIFAAAFIVFGVLFFLMFARKHRKLVKSM